MGSSTSKSRKNHDGKHLPKVGTPANRQWEHDGQMRDAFGSRGLMIVVAALVVVAIVGLIILSI